MENVKKQVGDIHKVTCYADKELASAYRSVEGRMDDLSSKVGEHLTTSQNNNSGLSKEHIAALEKLSAIPFEKLEKLAAMEDDFTKLSARLTDLTAKLSCDTIQSNTCSATGSNQAMLI